MTTTVERIRTTISVDPEVYEIFKRMAEAGGMSVSRCMGEWLADTADGAQMVAIKMQEAREAPMKVMREFQAMAVGFQEEVDSTILKMQSEKRAVSTRSAVSATSRSPKPPSSNTGVLVPPSPLKSRSCTCVQTKHERQENRTCPVHFPLKSGVALKGKKP